VNTRAAQLSTREFTLRWIGLTLLAFAVAAACVFFGRWQWMRTQEIVEIERAQLATPVDITTVTTTDPNAATENIGRAVNATGVFDPTRQVFLAQRLLGQNVGVYVVSALTLADGSVIPVMRGWLPSSTSPGAQPPSGEVLVTGILTGFEKFYSAADPNNLVSMSEETIRTPWSARDGMLWLTSVSPATSPAPQPVPTSIALADVPFPWQNFFYAFQWWVFAAFAIGLWARWLVLERRARTTESTTVGES